MDDWEHWREMTADIVDDDKFQRPRWHIVGKQPTRKLARPDDIVDLSKDGQFLSWDDREMWRQYLDFRSKMEARRIVYE